MRTKLLPEDIRIDIPKQAALRSNSVDFLRLMLKEADQVKVQAPLPLVLFMNARLYHGHELIDTTTNIVLPIRDDIDLGGQEIYFSSYSIGWMPLEARVTFELSVIYSDSYIQKMAIASYSVFDSFGILRTGYRVQSVKKEITPLEIPDQPDSWNSGRIIFRR